MKRINLFSIISLLALVLLVLSGFFKQQLQDEDMSHKDSRKDKEIQSLYIDIRDYGAAADDNLGDSEAINQAILTALTRGLPVFIPAGEFMIDGTIKLMDHTELIGAEGACLIIGEGLTTVFDLTEKSDLMIKNLVINNRNHEGHDIFYALNGKAAENVSIEGIRSINGGKSFIYAKNLRNLTLKENAIYMTSFRAINIYNPDGLLIEANSIYGTKSGFGINVESGSEGIYEIKDVVISGNLVKDTEDGAITVRALRNSMHHITIVDNQIFNAGKAGIKATIPAGYENTELYQILIEANRIEGFALNYAEAGITVSDYNHQASVFDARITGNHIIGGETALYGLRLQGSREIFAYGNEIMGGFQSSGVFVENSSSIELSNNTVMNSCQKNQPEGVHGGILLSMSSECVVASNEVLDNGSYICNAAGIYVYRTRDSIICDNLIQDRRVTKYQDYSIYESEAGGADYWSRDNLYKNNVTEQPYIITIRSVME